MNNAELIAEARALAKQQPESMARDMIFRLIPVIEIAEVQKNELNVEIKRLRETIENLTFECKEYCSGECLHYNEEKQNCRMFKACKALEEK